MDNLSCQIKVTEGTGDLGGTAYLTDADGNVVFGPNTPQEKKKTTVTGKKMQKRKGKTKTNPQVDLCTCICVCPCYCMDRNGLYSFLCRPTVNTIHYGKT